MQERGCQPCAEGRGAGRDDPRARLEIERRRAEGRSLGQVDGESSFAHDELGRGDVDRPRPLQRHDAVDTAGRKMAERDGKRAHHAQPVGDPHEARGTLGDEGGGRRLERENLELVLRPLEELRAVQQRAATLDRGPLLAGPEVVDVRGVHIVHRSPVGDRDRDRKERDPSLRVQRSVNRVDDDGDRAVAFRADLLADDARAGPAKTLEDHPLGGGIDGGRRVAALATADDGLSLRPGRQLLEHARDIRARLAAQREPVLGLQSGKRTRPDVSFG